ncbi:radical SAM protein [bacterium]|nr:radical SAM protein [bacterium]
MDTYVYAIEDNVENISTLYVNLTNNCTNSCIFCIRNLVDEIKGKRMWLESEDFSANNVIAQFDMYNKPDEVVFCGYGESLMKFDLLKEIATYVKKQNIKTRINTNGIGNVINKRDIVPELADIIDEVSISLNAPNKEQYNLISRPKYENAYDAMLDFAKKCVENNIKTTLTVVDEYPDYKLDIPKCKEIADKIGAGFKIRKWLNNGY